MSANARGGRVDAVQDRTIPWSATDTDPGEFDRIAEHLRGGGVLVYPTETVYGLGAAATVEGVERVHRLKGRGDESPFLLLLPSAGAPEFAPTRWGLDLPESARSAASGLWPGPLTMVLSDRAGHFPPGIRSASGGVAVRVSSHPFVGALMARWDQPLISTSANRTGATPSRTASEIRGVLAPMPGLTGLWIVDAGPLPVSMASTVIDFTQSPPRILRQGVVPFVELARRIPGLTR